MSSRPLSGTPFTDIFLKLGTSGREARARTMGILWEVCHGIIMTGEKSKLMRGRGL